MLNPVLVEAPQGTDRDGRTSAHQAAAGGPAGAGGSSLLCSEETRPP